MEEEPTDPQDEAKPLSPGSIPRPATGFDLIADCVGSIKDGPCDMSGRKKDFLKSTGYGSKKRKS